jgi:hypothetical protein
MKFTVSLALILMAAATGDPLLDWLAQAGSVGILSFIVIAFLKGWIVSGSVAKERLRECTEQRDKALELVYKHAEIATRALEVSEKK